MKQSRAFQPASPDVLESRMVLSQVYFSPPTGIISPPVASSGSHKPAQVHLLKQADATTRVTLQTDQGKGRFETVNVTLTKSSGDETSVGTITDEPGVGVKTSHEVATTTGATTRFSKTITLPGGIKETETGTNVHSPSTATILDDGTLQANPGATTMTSELTSFQHFIARTDGQTETIDGTSIAQSIRPGLTRTVTQQTVVHFDGSTDDVTIYTVRHGATESSRTTTTAPDGATTKVESTSKVSASVSA